MNFDEEVKPYIKKVRRGVSSALKRRIWDTYIGPGIKEQLCPLCNVHRISATVNSGFDAAHIVAEKYLTEDLSHYYLYPSCASCNNECKDMCLLDFLFCIGRIKELRNVINNIYRVFTAEHEPEFVWKILEHLYGRFPAGGGLVNTKAIYEIARGEQLKVLATKMSLLAREMETASREFRDVTSAEIKTMKFV
jgi:hypothetical protein